MLSMEQIFVKTYMTIMVQSYFISHRGDALSDAYVSPFR